MITLIDSKDLTFTRLMVHLSSSMIHQSAQLKLTIYLLAFGSVDGLCSTVTLFLWKSSSLIPIMVFPRPQYFLLLCFWHSCTSLLTIYIVQANSDNQSTRKSSNKHGKKSFLFINQMDILTLILIRLKKNFKIISIKLTTDLHHFKSSQLKFQNKLWKVYKKKSQTKVMLKIKPILQMQLKVT